MNYYKASLFPEMFQHQALIYKALSHPARLAILEYLAQTKICMVGDITKELPISRTTINQHLEVLKDAELIKGTISGSRTNYCLNVRKVEEVTISLNKFMHHLNMGQANSCS